MDELRRQLVALRDELRSLVDLGDSITDEQATRADEISAEIREVSGKIESHERRAEALAEAERRASIADEVEQRDSGRVEHRPSVQVTSEERTYGLAAEQVHRRSFISDVINAQCRGDFDAAQRLSQHMKEERIERAAHLKGLESRDVGTGAFAGLTVPQYLTDMAGLPKRPMRPFADLCCTPLSLPAEGMVVSISRGITGTATAVQASENAGVQETDYDDTQLDVPVRTISGKQDVSLQAQQRSRGADQVIIRDLRNAYHSTLDNQILNGAGTSGTHLGVLSTSGIVAVTYTDASPTAAEAYPKIFDLISQIQSGVFGGATHLVMAPRRWNWFASQVGTSFPFLQPMQTQAVNVGGEVQSNSYGGVVGILAGLPVVLDGNIPTNLGAGTNQDPIVGVSADEAFLWEDPDAPLLISAENPSNLQVTLVVYGFSAFTAGRFPGAHGAINGTGLITPTF